MILRSNVRTDSYTHLDVYKRQAMDAAKTSELRRKCFKAGIKLVVVKNSLLHKALMSMEDVDFSPLFNSLNPLIVKNDLKLKNLS